MERQEQWIVGVEDSYISTLLFASTSSQKKALKLKLSSPGKRTLRGLLFLERTCISD